MQSGVIGVYRLSKAYAQRIQTENCELFEMAIAKNIRKSAEMELLKDP